MATQSSSISISIAVNPKNLAGVDKLNNTLKTLKTNISGLYGTLNSTNATLGKTATASKNAASGINKMAVEVNNAARAAKQQASSDQRTTSALIQGQKNWYTQKAKM